jgi:putative ABC transport system permease protein
VDSVLGPAARPEAPSQVDVSPPSLAAGATSTAVYASVKGWSVVVPPVAWGGGFGIAVFIGAMAGLLPALRTARLSPAEALWAI